MEQNENGGAGVALVKPHSNEAEAALLGSMLIDPDIVGLVSKRIDSGEAFYNRINGLVPGVRQKGGGAGCGEGEGPVWERYRRRSWVR